MPQRDGHQNRPGPSTRPRRGHRIAGYILGLLLAVLLRPGAPLHAEDENQVALAIQFGDGSLVTHCVSFTETEITGLQALERTGLALTLDYNSVGAAVCAIDDEGCPADDCLTCDPDYDYWSYWHWESGAWAYAGMGSNSYMVQDGDIEGWQWGAGDPPPAVTFDEVCAPIATSTPTPSPVPAVTPVPAATATPAPNIQFWADGTSVAAGTCTSVHWIAENIESVTLNGETVNSEGFVTTCPCEATDFTLSVVTLDGTRDTRHLTVETTGSCNNTTTTSVIATPTRPPTSTPESTQPPATAAPATTSPPTATPLPASPTSTPTRRTRRRTPAATSTPAAMMSTIATPTPDIGQVSAVAPQPTEPPEPTATPTRAAVEGFDTAKPTRAFRIPSSFAIFGLLLVAIGVSSIFLVKRP